MESPYIAADLSAQFMHLYRRQAMSGDVVSLYACAHEVHKSLFGYRRALGTG